MIYTKISWIDRFIPTICWSCFDVLHKFWVRPFMCIDDILDLISLFDSVLFVMLCIFLVDMIVELVKSPKQKVSMLTLFNLLQEEFGNKMSALQNFSLHRCAVDLCLTTQYRIAIRQWIDHPGWNCRITSASSFVQRQSRIPTTDEFSKVTLL